MKWLSYWSFHCIIPFIICCYQNHVRASHILPGKEKEISQPQVRRCLRISSPAVLIFSFLSFNPTQFPNRCYLFGCSDIFWKIVMPKLYRPCVLLEHNGNRLLLGSPSAEFPAEPLESSQPPCLSWAVPPSSELLRTLAGSVVLYINSAVARSGCRVLPDKGCAGVKGAL